MISKWRIVPETKYRYYCFSLTVLFYLHLFSNMTIDFTLSPNIFHFKLQFLTESNFDCNLSFIYVLTSSAFEIDLFRFYYYFCSFFFYRCFFKFIPIDRSKGEREREREREPEPKFPILPVINVRVFDLPPTSPNWYKSFGHLHSDLRFMFKLSNIYDWRNWMKKLNLFYVSMFSILNLDWY